MDVRQYSRLKLLQTCVELGNFENLIHIYYMTNYGICPLLIHDDSSKPLGEKHNDKN